MPEFHPRGREIQWPAPWEGIGADWYGDCRERRPAPAEWLAFKRRVYDALPADRLLTLAEIRAATDATDDALLLGTLHVLCDRERSAVCIQNDPNDGGPYFCRARGAGADYTDVYTKRMAARSQ